MSIFGTITNFLGGGSAEGEETDYNSLPYEKLLLKASEIKAETNKMKSKVDKFNTENNILKNSIINNSTNGAESKFGLLYNNMKNSYLKQKSTNFDINDFKNYLCKQKLFYGISNEDNINFIKLKEIKDDWSDNKNEYLFRQNMLERNLNEFYQKILVSKELNSQFKKKNLLINENNEKNKKEHKKEDIENNEIKATKKETKIHIPDNNIINEEDNDNLIKLDDIIKNKKIEQESGKEEKFKKEKIIKKEIKNKEVLKEDEEIKNKDIAKEDEELKNKEVKKDEGKEEEIKKEEPTNDEEKRAKNPKKEELINEEDEKEEKNEKKEEDKKKKKKKSDKKKKKGESEKKANQQNKLNDININLNSNDFKLGFPDKKKEDEKNILDGFDLLSD